MRRAHNHYDGQQEGSLQPGGRMARTRNAEIILVNGEIGIFLENTYFGTFLEMTILTPSRPPNGAKIFAETKYIYDIFSFLVDQQIIFFCFFP